MLLNLLFGLFLVSIKSAEVQSWTSANIAESSEGVDETCLNDLNYLSSMLWNESESNDWALQFMDSSGKPPMSLLHGNYNWLGNKTQCSEAKTYDASISGLLCVAEYAVQHSSGEQKQIMQEICLPDSCRHIKVLNKSENTYLNNGGTNSMFTYNSDSATINCPPTVEDSFARRSFIYFILAILALTCLGTAADLFARIFLNRKEMDEKSKPLWTVLNYFSVIRNTSLLFSLRSQNEVGIFHTIRNFGVTGVFVCHLQALSKPNVFARMLKSTNFEETEDSEIPFWSLSLMEIFFVLSGILVYRSSAFRNATYKSFAWIKFVAHRYLKLVPLLGLVIWLKIAGVDQNFGSPLMRLLLSNDYASICSKNWWTNLLFINNIWKLESECIMVSWYIAVDMQLYILSPLFVLGLKRSTRFGLTVILVASLVCWTYSGLMSYKAYTSEFKTFGRKRIISLGFLNEFVRNVYKPPLLHLPSYLIGILVGHFLQHYDVKKIPLSRVNLMGVIFMIGLPLTLPLSHYDLGAFGAAIHVFISRLETAAFLAFIVVACFSGKWPTLKSISEWHFWVPLGRMSYVFYLSHFYLLYNYMATRTSPLNLRTQEGVVVLLGSFWFCYIISVLVTVCFVIPVAHLTHLLFMKSSKRVECATFESKARNCKDQETKNERF